MRIGVFGFLVLCFEAKEDSRFAREEKSLPGKKGKAKKPITARVVAAPEVPGGSGAAGAGFHIVGIGASAGGLAAFEAFFSGMPPDTDPGMAFVLVQHLAPDHKSILTELIGRYTRMRVSEATDGVVVRPNCAYIIPPNRDMAFLNGALHLLEPTAIRPRSWRWRNRLSRSSSPASPPRPRSASGRRAARPARRRTPSPSFSPSARER